MRLTLISAALAFALDQFTKWLVVHQMNLAEVRSIDVLPPLLNLRMGWNTGINFGLFAGSPDAMRWILTVLAVVVSAWLLHWSTTAMTRPVLKVSAGLVIGGALANALDRVIYGAVADFLNMSCCGVTNPFTFNVADIFIFAGAFGLIVFADTEKGA